MAPGLLILALLISALLILALLSRDGSRILRVERVGVTGADTIINTASILTVVGAVGLAPLLGIQGAICPCWNIGDGQDIRVEEVLGHVSLGESTTEIVLDRVRTQEL